MRSIANILVLGVFTAYAAAAGSEGRAEVGAVEDQTAKQLARVVGDPDSGLLDRLASRLSARQLVAAMYRGTRSQRLAALEVAGRLRDPLSVLPYLAAFMGAAERQSASRAASSLLTALQRLSSRPGPVPDLVEGQGDQLAKALVEPALNRKLETDMRVAAIESVGLLGRLLHKRYTLGPELLNDENEAVRSAARADLAPPFSESDLTLLAEAVAEDESSVLRGQAAALLCENALLHGVKSPSADLKKLLAAHLSAGHGAQAIMPLLVCLSRFAPEARADLVDLALKHPDPAVSEYWKAITDH